MKRILLAIMICSALLASAQMGRPKLVVGVVVDQMRWDYLYYYNDYGEGGLRRLLDEGFSCENNMINYVPTVTAIGHTSNYTGTTPFFHGIAGNSFMIDGKPVSSTDDKSVEGVGTDGKAGMNSPRNLRATTIGDELKVQEQGLWCCHQRSCRDITSWPQCRCCLLVGQRGGAFCYQHLLHGSPASMGGEIQQRLRH